MIEGRDLEQRHWTSLQQSLSRMTAQRLPARRTLFTTFLPGPRGRRGMAQGRVCLPSAERSGIAATTSLHQVHLAGGRGDRGPARRCTLSHDRRATSPGSLSGGARSPGLLGWPGGVSPGGWTDRPPERFNRVLEFRVVYASGLHGDQIQRVSSRSRVPWLWSGARRAGFRQRGHRLRLRDQRCTKRD